MAAGVLGLLGAGMVAVGLLPTIAPPTPDDPQPLAPFIVLTVLGLVMLALTALWVVVARRLGGWVQGTTLTVVTRRAWAVDLATVDRAEVILGGDPDMGFPVPLLRLGSDRAVRTLRLAYAGGRHTLKADDLMQLAAALEANPNSAAVGPAITALRDLAIGKLPPR